MQRMTWRRYTTADGWPGIHWEQLVPTGETLFARRRELQARCAVLLGLALFGTLLGIGFPLIWSVTGSLVAGLVVASPEIARSLPVGVGEHTPRGPSEHERMLEAEAKVVRYGRWEKRWAEAVLDQEARTLRLVVTSGGSDAGSTLFSVPLFDFAELELGTDEEWLGDAGSRELREMAQRGAAWVIVAQTVSQGVLVIAYSGGSKREMAELHRVLLAAFVAERPALRARLDEVLTDV
jgi:hypothetical protein